MLNLYCKKCNYRFTKEKTPKRCPYCSADGTIHKTKSAQELLDEVIHETSEMDKGKET